MIQRVICNPVVRMLVAITAILGYAHSSAYAQGSRHRGLVTPHLIFSTYLGGKTPCKSCNGVTHTFAQNAAADWEGNTCVTGATTVSDLPVSKNAFQKQPAPGSTMSAFVAKYSPAGKLLWCTYLGGNNQSMGIGVAVMPDGGVAVAGLTSSDAKGPFPTMNAFQKKNNGKTDYFVTVFDRNGKVRYSTYLGGSGAEGTPEAPFADDYQQWQQYRRRCTGPDLCHGHYRFGRWRHGDQVPGDPQCHPERPKGEKGCLPDHIESPKERLRLIALLQLSWRQWRR